MKSACPAPAGHHSTRQWLVRSDMLPAAVMAQADEGVLAGHQDLVGVDGCGHGVWVLRGSETA